MWAHHHRGGDDVHDRVRIRNRIRRHRDYVHDDVFRLRSLLTSIGFYIVAFPFDVGFLIEFQPERLFAGLTRFIQNEFIFHLCGGSCDGTVIQRNERGIRFFSELFHDLTEVNGIGFDLGDYTLLICFGIRNDLGGLRIRLIDLFHKS